MAIYNAGDGNIDVSLTEEAVQAVLVLRFSDGSKAYHLAWSDLRGASDALINLSFRLRDLADEVGEPQMTKDGE